jgi:GT2 family glycosyltransferase
LDLRQVAVVILNYNGKSWLEKFLPFVIQYSGHAHVVVADNHSTDGSVAFLREKFSSVDCIEISSNLGFCGGYNFALKQVKEKYYVLLNSDVEVTPGWIEPLVTLLENNPAIAAAQPKVLSYFDRTMFEYAGAGGGFIDSLGYPFCRGRIFDQLEPDHGQYNDTRQVFWATGACLFIRSECYHQLGGLDEDFFAHMEEIDLCWRLQRVGYQIYYQGLSTVYHVGGGTLATSHPQKTYFNFRNGLSLIYKNMNGFQLLWKLPLRAMLDWVAAFKFLLGGFTGNFKAVVRAKFDFYRNVIRDHGKRKSISADLKAAYSSTVYKRLLIIDYFLLGKKCFKDLRF